ncbi:MAG: hypothetical protein H6729_10660 [Deltaproteobacteria bacterium]|nr:hypothetical protein [Deltaproteobacteria bacterium]
MFLSAFGPATRATLLQQLPEAPKNARAALMLVMSDSALMAHVNRAHLDSPLLAREPEITDLMQTWLSAGTVDKQRLRNVLEANGLWAEGFVRTLPRHLRKWSGERSRLLNEAEIIRTNLVSALGRKPDTKQRNNPEADRWAGNVDGTGRKLATIEQQLLAIADELTNASTSRQSPWNAADVWSSRAS